MRETRRRPVERPAEWLVLHIPDGDDETHNRGSGSGLKRCGLTSETFIIEWLMTRLGGTT